MSELPETLNNIFSLSEGFLHEALRQYRFQMAENPVFAQWASLTGQTRDLSSIKSLTELTSLPVSFFKTDAVVSGSPLPDFYFESSGTTGMQNSRHYVRELRLYEESFFRGFELFYGPCTDWCVLALLPAYLERKGSSLVYMAEKMIRASGHPDSGFYLYEHAALARKLQELEAKGQKTLLLGVTFALLDFSVAYPLKLQHTVVMETGGMKGRGRELTRAELHERLSEGFGTSAIHAEFGMTELLSQAYSFGDGMYQPVPWLKPLVRSEDDPFDVRETGEGILQWIDLANLHSCSFIATQDMGKIHPDGRFEVFGRMDHSDLRGCSLLVI